MPEIKLIAAIDSKNGIAANNKLPWDLPSDRKYFKDHVKKGPVVMGWKTFTANGFKPYGDGDNIVITRRNVEAAPGVWIVHDADVYFRTLQNDVWVAGGGMIFTAALPYAAKLYISKVEGDFGCDVFLPIFEKQFHRIDHNHSQVENGITFTYEIWERNTQITAKLV